MASQTETALLELSGKFERMMDNIEIVKDKQEEMASDIVKIKEAVYNPDEGIYARIRELESFKRQVSKVLWIVMTALIGLGIHQVLSSMQGGKMTTRRYYDKYKKVKKPKIQDDSVLGRIENILNIPIVYENTKQFSTLLF